MVCSSGEMDVWVFRKCISEQQPVCALGVDCMVEVESTPELLWKHPWVNCRFWLSILILSTRYAVSACSFDILIDVWPVDCCVSKLLHAMHSKMS